jgi:hypothetical protein
MDERQTQVVAGAGLQESRLNTDFIDFLSKWGPRALYVVLAVVLAFLGWQQWTRYQSRQTDQAFADYESQVLARSPDLLLKVAQDHAGQHAVWSLAMRDAANLLMDAGIVGTAPGADPLAPRPEDTLSPDQRTQMFQRAEGIFREVIDKNTGPGGQLIYAQQARWGLTSALLSLGKQADGEKLLETFVAEAENADMPDLAAFGRHRLERIREVGAAPIIVSEASLPPAAIRGRAGSVRLDSSTNVVTDPSTGISIQKLDPTEVPPMEDTPLPEGDDPGTAPEEPSPE